MVCVFRTRWFPAWRHFGRQHQLLEWISVCCFTNFKLSPAESILSNMRIRVCEARNFRFSQLKGWRSINMTRLWKRLFKTRFTGFSICSPEFTILSLLLPCRMGKGEALYSQKLISLPKVSWCGPRGFWLNITFVLSLKMHFQHCLYEFRKCKSIFGRVQLQFSLPDVQQPSEIQ